MTDLEAAVSAQGEETRKGQRAINEMWEATQARIAIRAVMTTLYVSSFVVVATVLLAIIILIRGQGEIAQQLMALAISAFLALTSTMNMILGFYFSRTNHTRTGGVAADQVGR